MTSASCSRPKLRPMIEDPSNWRRGERLTLTPLLAAEVEADKVGERGPLELEEERVLDLDHRLAAEVEVDEVVEHGPPRTGEEPTLGPGYLLYSPAEPAPGTHLATLVAPRL